MPTVRIAAAYVAPSYRLMHAYAVPAQCLMATYIGPTCHLYITYVTPARRLLNALPHLHYTYLSPIFRLYRRQKVPTYCLVGRQTDYFLPKLRLKTAWRAPTFRLLLPTARCRKTVLPPSDHPSVVSKIRM